MGKEVGDFFYFLWSRCECQFSQLLCFTGRSSMPRGRRRADGRLELFFVWRCRISSRCQYRRFELFLFLVVPLSAAVTCTRFFYFFVSITMGYAAVAALPGVIQPQADGGKESCRREPSVTRNRAIVTTGGGVLLLCTFWDSMDSYRCYLPGYGGVV